MLVIFPFETKSLYEKAGVPSIRRPSFGGDNKVSQGPGQFEMAHRASARQQAVGIKKSSAVLLEAAKR